MSRMLIDFDWIGAHGIRRYPASSENGLPDWVLSGIQRYGIMDEARDLVMLKQVQGSMQFGLVTVTLFHTSFLSC